MDVLYCKVQLAWIINNANNAQEHLNNGDSALVFSELLFMERAIQRTREELNNPTRSALLERAR